MRWPTNMSQAFAPASCANYLPSCARRLARFPLSGRVVPEFPTGSFREVLVGNYRIIYEPAERQVEILTIMHGARDLTALPPPGDN